MLIDAPCFEGEKNPMLRCVVNVVCLMGLLHLNRVWQEVNSLQSAFLTILKSKWFVLHVSQSLSVAIFAALGMEIGSCNTL